MGFDSSIVEKAGLLVFDECHLLHPTGAASDRRALDAMLCVINFARIAPDADFLLLSAMMKNTEEIAEWIEDLTQRQCLSLSLSWKPTRQLRGSVVYQDRDISALNTMLQDRRPGTPTKTVPAAVKRAVPARPFGLFSLKQTWATRARNDYAFSPLLDEAPLLGVNSSWLLTPNSGEVSSANRCGSGEIGHQDVDLLSDHSQHSQRREEDFQPPRPHAHPPLPKKNENYTISRNGSSETPHTCISP